MKKEFKIIIFIFVLALIIVGGFYFVKDNKKIEPNIQKEKPLITTQKPTSTLSPTKSTENEEKIPEDYKIKNVPFTPQAPFAKWDFDHNEACEEAAILMVHYFYQKKSLTPEVADEEILKMVSYQKKNWGGHFDLEAKEIKKLAEEYYGYKKTKIIYNATIEDIKTEIAKDRPVILPTAGRLLGNPNYRRPGPIYHALVVIGYTRTKIITHDPGTRNGKYFIYSYNTIERAMHEWNGGDIYKGRKTAIILN